jgi:hypothetical protein
MKRSRGSCSMADRTRASLMPRRSSSCRSCVPGDGRSLGAEVRGQAPEVRELRLHTLIVPLRAGGQGDGGVPGGAADKAGGEQDYEGHGPRHPARSQHDASPVSGQGHAGAGHRRSVGRNCGRARFPRGAKKPGKCYRGARRKTRRVRGDAEKRGVLCEEWPKIRSCRRLRQRLAQNAF